MPELQITPEDMNSLMQVDELTRVKVHNIALQRRVAELEAENTELKAGPSTNNKKDIKLTAVGAD
jgi:BMFP domain-containing protein YqiC